jgi:hypothetical protein
MHVHLYTKLRMCVTSMWKRRTRRWMWSNLLLALCTWYRNDLEKINWLFSRFPILLLPQSVHFRRPYRTDSKFCYGSFVCARQTAFVSHRFRLTNWNFNVNSTKKETEIFTHKQKLRIPSNENMLGTLECHKKITESPDHTSTYTWQFPCAQAYGTAHSCREQIWGIESN